MLSRVWPFVAVLVLLCSADAVARSKPEVLLVVRESPSAFLVETVGTRNDEIFRMKSALEVAGYQVAVTSMSGRPLVFSLDPDMQIVPALTIPEVDVDDYIAFLVPGVHSHLRPLQPEEIALAEEIGRTGRPIAAQDGGVGLLGESGVLAGKRYSYRGEVIGFRLPDNSMVYVDSGGVYAGNSVVQDGNIITSSYSFPHTADQTDELMSVFIEELNRATE